ncbi:MAG TPA: hypothetical protein VMU14_16370, partial [Acidimicrobiales bacterium]|nr:hypothetical protein [Acidimicrobiales bacterium]
MMVVERIEHSAIVDLHAIATLSRARDLTKVQGWSSERVTVMCRAPRRPVPELACAAGGAGL